MCVAVPGRVIEVDKKNSQAVVWVFGVTRSVNTMLVGEVYEGDYLIAHTGYAIEKLDIEEAKERLKLWEEYLAYLKPETEPSQTQ